MDIGKRVRDAREARGITQEELARRAGVPLNRVGRIETGAVTDPHYSTLSRIAGGLDVSVGELLQEPVPLAEAPLSPEQALSIADDDSFRRTIEVVPTEELRGLVVELVGGYKPYRSLGDARSEVREEVFRRVKAFHRAALIDEELERRGAESPEIYPIALQSFMNAMGPSETPARSQERGDQETA